MSDSEEVKETKKSRLLMPLVGLVLAFIVDGYSFLIEVIYRVVNKGFKFSEVPITCVNRSVGRSKLANIEIARAINTVSRLKFLST